ncbi:hypothetical protein [Desulfoluna spongiiphila]|uniref:hypothetical protein n=1 Tax=Desulfoluna spongiiphila TaxID=419481 RepID=UPI000B831786|nr:hypothetical protein [Desulfoluna spongiiphila]
MPSSRPKGKKIEQNTENDILHFLSNCFSDTTTKQLKGHAFYGERAQKGLQQQGWQLRQAKDTLIAGVDVL